MNDVIEWLNSDDGIKWSKCVHQHIPTTLLVTTKDNHGDPRISLFNEAYDWEPLSDDEREMETRHYELTCDVLSDLTIEFNNAA